MRAAAAAACCAATLVAGGCDDSEPAAKAPAPPVQPDSGRPARPQDTAVIRRWANTLRSGRVMAAADDFTVPSVAANGGPAINLLTRRDTRLFNQSLPCGAVLLSTRRDGPFTVGVFRLTERPGGGCGVGVGQKAATAFRIEQGKIQEWRRVPLPTGPAPRQKPAPSREV